MLSPSPGSGKPARAHEPKVPYLDGWRGLAILAVLNAHFLVPHGGRFGVTLFFVLSGFFMSHILFIKETDLPTFFVRRFSRVVPTFWIFIAAMVAYAAWGQPTPYQVPAREVLTTVTFLRTYLPRSPSIFSDRWAFGHVWTLNVEEHSYVYLAGCLWLYRRARSRAFLDALLLGTVVVLLALTLRLCFSAWTPLQAVETQYAALPLVASAAYRVLLHDRPHLRRRLVVPSWALVACFLLALLLASVSSVLGATVLSPLLLAFTINHLDNLSERLKRLLSFAPLRWFGLCSYSLYLWQQPFYIYYARFHAAPAGLCLVGAIVTGAASFYLLENPLRIRLNASWDRRALASRARESAPSIALGP